MPPFVESLDLTWVLICSAMVMLMQGGFAVLETGFVRAKNSINIALKNVVDFCISGLMYWAVGFGMMFGLSYSGLIGTSHFIPDETHPPQWLAFLLFQLMFCSTATTIVAGAVAERMRFASYLLLAVAISGFIYPIFGHWAWGDDGHTVGWLKQLGFIDFAGATVVHSVGGWVGLAAAISVGPRIGRFQAGQPPIAGHNLALATLGAFLLWFGWQGFNGGSTLAMTVDTARVLLNTNLAAAAGGLLAMAVAWHVTNRPMAEPMINGVLGGLVAVTAGANLLSPDTAIVTGAVGGAISFWGGRFLACRRIDDAVGSIPVHAFAGAWGTIAVALFGDSAGFAMSRFEQLNVQLLGVTVCALWALSTGFLACFVINRIVAIRVPVFDELEGLNFSEHGASTELVDLLRQMNDHRQRGDFSVPVAVEPHTEVGQIATEYNRVLSRVREEISERDAAREAAIAAEDKYRSIFENAVEGIFRTSPEGRFLDANPALARLYGYATPQELMQEMTDIGRQLYVETKRRQQFMASLERQSTVMGFESQVYRRDGRIFWISESAHAVRDGEGRLLYYEGHVEDITRRKENEDLQRQMELVESANAAKTTFLARMSHEIRTPLNGVIGMLELLSATKLDQKQHQYCRIGHSSANALLSLINDILDFSKIEAGKLDLESIDFDLHELLDDIAEMFGHRAQAKGLELSCRILPEVPRGVVGDPERLRQIMINLASNAIKFTEAGEIRLEVETISQSPDDALLRFTVTDTGCGIPAEGQERLFQAFSQSASSISRTHGGTGLGLAISKQLVELMGGHIGVASEFGMGSTFWFEVPFGKNSDGPRPSSDQLPVEMRGARILVVDDTDSNRQILRDHLSGWGCEVTTAVDAESGLEILYQAARSQRPFSLALLDQKLPGMDGLTLAQTIKNDDLLKPMPIVMLISVDQAYDAAREQDLGLAACLAKPIRRSRLLTILSDVCRSGSLHSPDRLQGSDKRFDHLAPPKTTLGRTEGLPEGVSRRVRILVAEDNDVNQIVVEELLSSLGYECVIANHGADAWSLLQQRHFDLLLADCQMPVMDGWELTRTIREKERQTGQHRLPIVALTANAIKGDREKCLSAGMDDYLTKPLHREDLIQTLLRHLPGPSSDKDAHEWPSLENDPPIDWQAFEERCGNDVSFRNKILAKFRQRLTADLRQIELLAIAQEWASIGSLAHSLKGAAGNVAANDLFLSAGRLEAVCRDEKPKALEKELGILQSAAQACTECIDAALNGASENALYRNPLSQQQENGVFEEI